MEKTHLELRQPKNKVMITIISILVQRRKKEETILEEGEMRAELQTQAN